MSAALHALANRTWYPGLRPPGAVGQLYRALSASLAPFGWAVASVARRRAHRRRVESDARVVVVGNLVAGGSGKTPLVGWLARALASRYGLRVGVVCRGYGGAAASWPRHVVADSDASVVGDEAVLLARLADCPVVAAPARADAVAALVERHAPDVVLSDDGLQHVPLARAAEVVVVDSVLGFGNGRCLPAGPLREPLDAVPLDAPRRLLVVRADASPRGDMAPAPVDSDGTHLVGGEHVAVVARARFSATGVRALAGAQVVGLDRWRGRRVRAVCGIAQPARFHASLRAAGIDFEPVVFPDHHTYRPADLAFTDGLAIVMTEKDAVKCERFAQPGWWALCGDIDVDGPLVERLAALLGVDP